MSVLCFSIVALVSRLLAVYLAVQVLLGVAFVIGRLVVGGIRGVDADDESGLRITESPGRLDVGPPPVGRIPLAPAPLAYVLFVFPIARELLVHMTADERGLHVRNWLRWYSFDWSQIEGFRVDDESWFRLASVVVIRTGGRAIRVRATCGHLGLDAQDDRRHVAHELRRLKKTYDTDARVALSRDGNPPRRHPSRARSHPRQHFHGRSSER